MSKDYNERLANIAITSSTSKIKKEFDSIFEGSEEKNNKNRRRWIWELIQNASDCTPKGATINIDLEIGNTEITFSHDGIPFTYNNLQDLITQVSTKEEFEEELTGKFGTGFMSTFLLSRIVRIEGTFTRNNGTSTNMNFTIDRSKRDYKGIKEQTIKMLDELDCLDNSSHKEQAVNKTKFTYNIEENSQESKEAVKKGGEDLSTVIPYLLVFNKNIQSISINGIRYEKGISKDSSRDNDQTLIQVKMIDKEEEKSTYVLTLRNNNVQVACPVEWKKDLNLLLFEEISDNIPKLFCNFPLIGSEDFAFPIIINSNLFGVTEDRDAIREGNEQNRTLLKEAISLYKDLIDICSNNIFTRNEFNICLFKKKHYKEIQEYCYDQITKYISRSPLIPINNSNNNYERKAYLNESGDIQIHIPTTKKENNSTAFWKIFSEGVFLDIPTEETFLGWKKVFNGNYQLNSLNGLFEHKTITDFNSSFASEEKIYKWLNRFYSLWIDDEGINEVIKSVFVPTQHQCFNHFKNVFYDDGIREDLKKILFELKPSCEKQLLNQCIESFNIYFEENASESQNTESCAKLIDNEVNRILVDETSGILERTREVQVTFNQLNDFFLKEPSLSEINFPKVFPKRMLVSSTTETLRRMEIAEKVERNGINLDEYLNNHQKIKDILESSDLNTEEMLNRLKHVVTPTPEMRGFVEKLLRRSVENVYNHLKKSKKYIIPSTLNEWKESSHTRTIFPAKKDGKDLIIVIRPTDNDQIIFYGEEELEALDSSDYELWTDNGKDHNCKEITLGELLKTTGITRIPLNKI